jgi:hypothetical protein
LARNREQKPVDTSSIERRAKSQGTNGFRQIEPDRAAGRARVDSVPVDTEFDAFVLTDVECRNGAVQAGHRCSATRPERRRHEGTHLVDAPSEPVQLDPKALSSC